MRYAVLGLACMLLVAAGTWNSLAAQEPAGPHERGEVAYLILHKTGSALGFYDRSGRLIETVPVGTHPHEMVLALDGRHVYVADNGVMLLTESGDGGNTVSIVDITEPQAALGSSASTASAARMASVSTGRPDGCS